MKSTPKRAEKESFNYTSYTDYLFFRANPTPARPMPNRRGWRIRGRHPVQSLCRGNYRPNRVLPGLPQLSSRSLDNLLRYLLK
jgi:hypothetical protein